MIEVLVHGPNLSSAAQKKGGVHVHTADCEDNGHYGPGRKFEGHDDGYPLQIMTKLAVAEFLYADHLGDFGIEDGTEDAVAFYQGELADIWFAPCVEFPSNSKVLEAEARIAKLEQDRPAAQKAYDKLWDKYTKKPGRPIDPQEEEKLDKASTVLHGIDHDIAAFKAQIKRLLNPTPQDEAKTRKLKEFTMSVKKIVADNSSVPAVYLKDGTDRFKPGWDAKYKSDLVRCSMGLPSVPGKSVMDFEAEDAIARLEQRGWTKYRETALRAADAKVARAAARAADAKAKVTAKKSRAKPQTTASKATSKATDQVTPDPKPAAAPKASRGRPIGR